MQVKSTVKMNFPRIKNLTQAAVTALEMTSEALLKEVKNSEIIPFDTGNLQDNTFVDSSQSESGRVQMVSSTPYARRLYYHPEYNFQTEEHAFASGQWYEPWLPGGISENFAKDAYKKFYKKVGDV